MSKNNTKNTLFHWHDFRLKIILESIAVGFFAGLVIVIYRYMIEKTLDFSRLIYGLQHQTPILVLAWIPLLILGGYFIGWLIEKEPMASGSGIPQVKGVLLRKLKMRWWSVLTVKFVGGIISIGAGLSLGREGPSIQMGAAIGQGFSRIFKRVKLEEKFLITSGASAGLAAAFNAPLSGVVFALEEVHKNFSPIVMTSALAASITADFVSSHFFGIRPIFDFKNLTVIPLNNYGYIILLGLIIGLWGVVFNKSLLRTQKFFSDIKCIPARFKPAISFLIAGFVGYFLPAVLGGGNDIVVNISTGSLPLRVLLVLLIVKFLFTMTSYGSSAPGGIFLPLLVIGALTGVLYGSILHLFIGLPASYISSMMILAMAAYFTAIVKAPITGIVLITEMTGSFTHLLSIAVVSLTAYVIVDVLDSPPIYEVLLHRFISKGASPFVGSSASKVLIESAVCMGSLMDGKKVAEIDWPPRCLLVSIKRGEEEIIPNGETVIAPSDYLIILANEDEAAEVRECISEVSETIAGSK